MSSNATAYSLALAAAAVATLALATRAPLATTVISLILFGLLHTVLELRYVLGRFGWVLHGSVGVLLLTLVTGIAVVRATGAYLGAAARPLEILLGYGVLAAGAWLGWRRSARTRGAAVLLLAVLAALAGCLAASLAFPAAHFVVLAHVHNLVPLAFLWHFARALPRPDRLVFRAVQVGWTLALPAVILLGGLDAVVDADPGVVRRLVGDGEAVRAGVAWPGAPELGTRFLVAFAFLQVMHYVVWVAFLPRVAPGATAAFEARWPTLTAPRVWAAGLLAALVLAVLLLSDYREGRSAYAALATYHAYLEFPVLLVLLQRGRLT